MTITEGALELLEVELLERLPHGKWLWRSVDDNNRRGFASAPLVSRRAVVGTRFVALASGGRFDTTLVRRTDQPDDLPTAEPVTRRRACPSTAVAERWEPGTVVLAWVPFTHVPGAKDMHVKGKYRPCIVLRDRGDTVTVRALFDGTTSFRARNHGSEVVDWREAGLAKPSVVDEHDTDVDPGEVVATLGRLSPRDAGRLQAWRPRGDRPCR